MKPDPKVIMREARRLKDDRFKTRDSILANKKALRFQQVDPDIPKGYKKTATVYKTPLMQSEGRAVGALVYAFPQVKMIPPTPEDQPLTTKCEQFLSAAHQELESKSGHMWWKSKMSQIHEDIGWIYAGMKRKPYDGQPSAPDEDADIMDVVKFKSDSTFFKREEGIAAVFDYRHVPTPTVYCVGDAGNPLAIYEIKEVDETEMMLTYGVQRDRSGEYTKLPKDVTSLPSGEPQDNDWTTAKDHSVRVIEYWDRNWCMILVENKGQYKNQTTEPYELDSWEHGWGRVPYFASPAFENEVMDEAYKYESPLNEIYNEAPHLNRLRTMMSNVAYLVGYPSWQLTTRESGDQLLDDAGAPKTQIEFVPGFIFQSAPGQEVLPLPMQTGNELAQEVLASEARMRQFALAEIAKGVSPGADTANSSLSQLSRLQRSALEPLSENDAMQAREMYRFWLARIKGTKGESLAETAYVYSAQSGEMIDLSPDDIPTMNIQVTVAPDTGQDALIEEKQALELLMVGKITEQEFHERRGKENPEEYVKANLLERFFMAQEMTLQQQILANLGDAQAIARMIEANQQTGDANTAVDGIMADAQNMQSGQLPGAGNGLGMGSPGMPRGAPVREPTIATNTQTGNYA